MSTPAQPISDAEIHQRWLSGIVGSIVSGLKADAAPGVSMANLGTVIEHLFEIGDWKTHCVWVTQADLVERCGLSRGTVRRALTFLVTTDLVKDVTDEQPAEIRETYPQSARCNDISLV
jgi:response regulator of citrate/malate metabolism